MHVRQSSSLLDILAIFEEAEFCAETVSSVARELILGQQMLN